MKKKILSITITSVLAAVLSSGCVFAQSSGHQLTTAEPAVSSQPADMKPDENIIMGTVKSVGDSSILIETVNRHMGGGPDKKTGNKPENGEEPPEKPEGEAPDNTEAGKRPEMTEGDAPERPAGTEKTVLIDSSTAILTENETEKTDADLTDITEGMIVMVKISDNSQSESDEVTALSVTASERKERPEGGKSDKPENVGTENSGQTESDSDDNKE